MALDCPRCTGGVLEELEIKSVVLDRCVRCAGLWFDNDEIGELIGRPQDLKALEAIVPSSAETEEGMMCPRCVSVPLRTMVVNESEARHSIIYRCVSCAGTWIDRGELRDQEDANIARVLDEFFRSTRSGG